MAWAIEAIHSIDRETWLDERRTCIGASDSPAILGHGYANQNAHTVWLSKTQPSIDRAANIKDDGKRFLIGQIMQPAILNLFTMETDLEVSDPGEFTICRHPEHPWLGATLDGYTEDDDGPAVVEAKNVGVHNAADWRDGTPLRYQIQVQHQLAATNLSHGYLIGLVGGFTPVIEKIERNERFISALIAKLDAWWHQFVVPRVQPPIDSSVATANVLKLLYPQDSGEAIELTDDHLAWFDFLARAKADKKDAERRERSAKNQITAALGDATFGAFPDGRACSWKTQTKAECVVSEATFRVFRSIKKLPKGVTISN